MKGAAQERKNRPLQKEMQKTEVWAQRCWRNEQISYSLKARYQDVCLEVILL